MIEQIPEIKETFDAFTSKVFEKEFLSDREKALLALAIVTSFEDEEGIKKAVMTCKQMMISNEEVGHVIAIVMALKAQKISKLFSIKDKKASSSTQRCC
jgi:Uncharacterized homolog of gamma-carboxymuconolactone decarboxylase subunit